MKFVNVIEIRISNIYCILYVHNNYTMGEFIYKQVKAHKYFGNSIHYTHANAQC